MSTKRVKHKTQSAKKVASSESGNGSEVLVLPPNLLEKLGINLDVIAKTKDSHYINKEEDIELPKNDEVENSVVTTEIQRLYTSDGSSMLETATLMKNSVFLSPTFGCNDVNTAPGEISDVSKEFEQNNTFEEVDIVNEDVKNISVHDYMVVPYADDVEMDDNSKSESVSGNIVTDSTVNDNIVENYTCNQSVDYLCSKNQSYTEKHEDVLLGNVGDILNSLEDQHDKVSPGNSNLRPVEHATTKYNDFSVENETLHVKEINIISEEIVTPSKYKKFDINLKNYALTAVPIDTIIYNNKIKNLNQIIPTEGKINSNNVDHACKPGSHTGNVDSKEHNGINIALNKSSESMLSIDKPINQDVNCVVTTPKSEILKPQHDFSGGLYSESNFYENNNETESTGLCNNLNMNSSCFTNNSEHHTKKQILSKEFNQKDKNTEVFNKSDDDVNINAKKQNIDSKNPIDGGNLQHACDNSYVSMNRRLTNVQECNGGIGDTHTNISSEREFSENSSSTGNITSDKVEEIAAYLMKFVTNHPNKKRNAHMKNNKGKQSRDLPKPENISTGVNKSKLSIQGVEKPGGVQDYERVKYAHTNLKTYGSHGRLKKFNKLEVVKELKIKSQNEVIIETEYDQKLNYINMSHSYKTKEFCVCGDFGRLTYYEGNSTYEHIHFWESKSIDCNSDIIYDICNDAIDYLNNKHIDSKYEKIYEDHVNSTQNSICWHYLKGEEENKEVDNNDASDILLVDFLTHSQTNRHSDTPKTEDGQGPSTNNFEIVSDNTAICEQVTKSIPEIANDDDVKIIPNICSLKKPDLLDIMKDTEVNIRDSLSEDIQVTEDEVLEGNIVTAIDTSEIPMHSDVKQVDDKYTHKADLDHIVLETERDVEYVKCVNSNANEIGTTDSDLRTTTNAITIVIQPLQDNKLNEGTPKLIGSENISLSNDGEIATEDENTEVTNTSREQNRRPSENNDSHSEKGDSSKQSVKSTNQVGRKRTYGSETVLRHSKRKRSDDSNSKKSIKCGVCSQWLSEAEWEDHSTNKHSLIAWKEGHVFDFENVELLSNLRQLLKRIGVLKCSFCSMEKKNSKNFLSHVKKCMQPDKKPKIDEQFSEDQLKPSVESSVICGVCKDNVELIDWMEHIQKEHNYLAWKETSKSIDLDDEDAVYQHLITICKEIGSLVCGKCGIVRKYAKAYMTHIRTCEGDKDQNIQEEDKRQVRPTIDVVKCGVCKAEMEESDWVAHIGKVHNYLAWTDGSTPLDLDDKQQVRLHLKKLSDDNGGLICSKCGKRKKNQKSYLTHVEECDPNMNKNLDNSNVDLNITIDMSPLDIGEKEPDSMLKCAVCQMEVVASDWIKHIMDKHNYLAWFEGQPALKIDDPEFVQKYLLLIVKKLGALKCSTCDLERKYPKVFLQHVFTCRNIVDSTLKVPGSTGEEVQCGVCMEFVHRKSFASHANSKHYDLAWIVGQEPIDLRNGGIVEKYLKSYGRHRSLVCRLCGLSRISCMGFYAHIIVCGKTEEEIEKFRDICEICNNKYLCIYKNQHMKAHKDQAIALLRKQERLEAIELKKEEPVETPGRRKAAEKAKTIIDKYTAYKSEGNVVCSVCGSYFEDERDLKEHKCDGEAANCSDSDVSVKLEQSSDDDDDDDVDSDISAEEHATRIREYDDKKSRSETSMSRLPFEVANPQKYMLASGEEFYDTHFTSDVLFNEWRSSVCEVVPENEINNYLPPLEESCSFKFNNDKWKVFKRFEATVNKGACMFTGACVQNAAWAPNMGDCEEHYLAVAAHRSNDTPRHSYDDILVHHSLIQIWDVGNFHMSIPKLKLGIAHEYGTVWSMSWCPSGARDSLPESGEYQELCRLGLLAVACSNGHAYIYSVPYPSTIPNSDNTFMYRLKPVVDLRIASTKRQEYAATSICWSPQRGHSIIVVGYADGTIAYFDLNNESPILRTVENDTIIIYPYKDERAQNISITETHVYPGVLCEGAGAVCAGAASGAGVRLAGRAVHAVAPAAAARFAALWPSMLLAGDNGIVTQPVNELELSGGGRRRGVTRRWAGCTRCGSLAAFQTPTLRITILHPADKFASRRQIFGCLGMVSRSSGRKRKFKSDDLAVELAPLTYEDAIKVYGLEWTDGSKERAFTPLRPEQPVRFPLGDVSAMEFYPSPRHHTRLALATHAGFVILVNSPNI